MHVFFEDDGQYKAGTVLADNEASLQVEAASGKRLKIKAGNVLLRFNGPAPAAMLAQAQKLAGELDPDFLWEVSGEDDFGFADLASEYYGHAPQPAEAAAVAFVLQSAPMYFYRRGKGRFRRAPADALKAALASIERKKREAEQAQVWVEQMKAHRLPDAFRPEAPDAPAQARQAGARMEGARRRLRRAADQPDRAARRVRRDPVDARLPLRRVPRARLSARHGLRRMGSSAAAPRSPACTGARVLRGRRDHHRDRRRILGARARQRPSRDRHPHRGPRARDCARLAARCDRARPAVDRLHARAQDHHAARRGDRRLHPRGRRRTPRAVALSAGHGGRHGGRPAHGRRSRAGRRQPASRSGRRRLRDRCTATRRAGMDRGFPRAVGRGAPARGRARQAGHRAHRLQLLRRLGSGARRPGGHRAASARLAARQARGRAHDLHEQHVGQASRRCARARASIARRATAR